MGRDLIVTPEFREMLLDLAHRAWDQSAIGTEREAAEKDEAVAELVAKMEGRPDPDTGREVEVFDCRYCRNGISYGCMGTCERDE